MPKYAVLLLLFSAPALSEVQHAAPDGFTLSNARVVPVAPEVAFRALVEDVGRWWPAGHTWWGDASKLSIQPRAGGCFCEIDGERQAWHMTVAFVDPPRLLRMTGGLGPLQGMGLNGALEWRFAAEGDGTRITLHYVVGGYSAGDLSAFAPTVDSVQAQQLGGLATHLGATDPGAEATEDGDSGGDTG